MAVLARHPLIDEILDARREHACGDTAAFEGCRNHAHRVYNFARSISSLSPEDEDKAAIAAAFHDLCVSTAWTTWNLRSRGCVLPAGDWT